MDEFKKGDRIIVGGYTGTVKGDSIPYWVSKGLPIEVELDAFDDLFYFSASELCLFYFSASELCREISV